MALAKHQTAHDSINMGSKVQTCVFNEYHHKSLLEEEDGSQNTNGLSNDSAITHSSPSLCGTSNDGYVYHKSTNYQLEEAESLIDFKDSGKSNLMQASGSLLSFQKEHCVWENDLQHQGYNQWNQIQLGTQESVLKKRPSMGENMKAVKKQCSTESIAPKPKSSSSKDPQSVAAKNRRERISERLKILQELVPNGSKVDLVTMLEKAISYVKFLQLQVKVLATDEFWPVQGGKAPDISQVKEVIDAILSSQRDRSSGSN